MPDSHLDLVPIDTSNWRQAYALQVAPDQRTFVAANGYSMLQALHEPDHTTLLALADGTPVGFAMYGEEAADVAGRHWLSRLMIGTEHQGRGYGRALLEAVVAHMRRSCPGRRIVLSYVPANDAAASMYRRFGFVDTGEEWDGERIMELAPD